MSAGGRFSKSVQNGLLGGGYPSVVIQTPESRFLRIRSSFERIPNRFEYFFRIRSYERSRTNVRTWVRIDSFFCIFILYFCVFFWWAMCENHHRFLMTALITDREDYKVQSRIVESPTKIERITHWYNLMGGAIVSSVWEIAQDDCVQ